MEKENSEIFEVIDFASRYLTSIENHGPCIGVYLSERQERQWHVEFAYFGFSSRNPTCDPGSLSVKVDYSGSNPKIISLYSLD